MKAWSNLLSSIWVSKNQMQLNRLGKKKFEQLKSENLKILKENTFDQCMNKCQVSTSNSIPDLISSAPIFGHQWFCWPTNWQSVCRFLFVGRADATWCDDSLKLRRSLVFCYSLNLPKEAINRLCLIRPSQLAKYCKYWSGLNLITDRVLVSSRKQENNNLWLQVLIITSYVIHKL